MCVRGREVIGVAQGRDGVAASNIKVVRITIDLHGGPEGTIRVHVSV
jgi:hypothetical protein